MNLQIQEDLISLHDALGKKLLNLVKDPDCTAADIRNALTFLKDNGVEINSRTVKNLEETIVRDIPFLAEANG